MYEWDRCYCGERETQIVCKKGQCYSGERDTQCMSGIDAIVVRGRHR